MILGKVMMVQNSCHPGDVDYLISKRILELKGNIKNYSMKRFIDEIGISRTSMVRYLKQIGIYKFSYFKDIMYDEYIQSYMGLKELKSINKSVPSNIKTLANTIKNANRVFILGDGNRYSLLIFQKALIFLDVDTSIPVYLGSEESVLEEYNVDEHDVVIFISLHETYKSFLLNRSYFYKDANYFSFSLPCQLIFVGETSDDHQDNNLHYPINHPDYADKVKSLIVLFEQIITSILNDLESF